MKKTAASPPPTPPDPSFIERHGRPFIVWLAAPIAYFVVVLGVFLKAGVHHFASLDVGTLATSATILTAGSAVYGGASAYVKAQTTDPPDPGV